MIRFAHIVAMGTVVLTAGAAAAQTATAPTVFNMKGTWKGNTEMIVDGPTSHHPAGAEAKSAGPYRLRQQNVTLKLDGQDGRRFWGTMSSEQMSNRLIGSLSMDGKWIYMAGSQGYVDAQIVDADTIEVCYRHANAISAVVGCNLMKRQK